ncbi:MAG: alpha-amylase [Candidatus Glassbacteria bacterium]|nr:alpha-amylase [Candidatus Glassbacteria bacterium]
MKDQPALIYNLFPRLAGPFTTWRLHLERAAAMGFNWLFINPVSIPGFSGSLYAVKDFYQFNPLFVDTESTLSPTRQFAQMVEQAHSLGLRVMVDLVINHTAIDSPLVKEHPGWYKRDQKGKIKNPGAYEDGKLVALWGDLAEVDNTRSADRDNLWEYWRQLVQFWLGLGVDGFRCDAAYKIPSALWRHLIGRARESAPATGWFAESLGCTIEQVVELAESGFDYVFNSSKYWDWRESWCLDQYEQSRQLAPSVSFPESHDTPRLAKELKGDPAAIGQRYLFEALFSTGVMIPLGFEFAFRKKTDVVHTTPDDWEATGVDLSGFIRAVNEFKLANDIFCREHPTYSFGLADGTGDVAGVLKLAAENGPGALLMINRSSSDTQHVVVENLRQALPGGPEIRLVVPGEKVRSEVVEGERFEADLPPAALWLLMRDSS